MYVRIFIDCNLYTNLQLHIYKDRVYQGSSVRCSSLLQPSPSRDYVTPTREKNRYQNTYIWNFVFRHFTAILRLVVSGKGNSQTVQFNCFVCRTCFILDH